MVCPIFISSWMTQSLSQVPVVDVHDGEHVPLPRRELVFDAMLVPLALHLHGREDEAAADEVGRVADPLWRLEAEIEDKYMHKDSQSQASTASVWPKIIAKCLQKLPKNDFTRKMIPFKKLPRNVGYLGKLIMAQGFEWLPQVQKLPNLVTVLWTLNTSPTVPFVAHSLTELFLRRILQKWKC